jgi:hypothetical protein
MLCRDSTSQLLPCQGLNTAAFRGSISKGGFQATYTQCIFDTRVHTQTVTAPDAVKDPQSGSGSR